MKHLGSIMDINGAEVEPVDIICGGSPCQDLSVAGKQKGLHEGERSHLFFEMTRIIKEMRNATNGKYPRYIIWENVPGAFSSNNGNDFYAVLSAFAEIADPDVHVPRPAYKGKTDRLAWQYAGTIMGDGYSIAWRTVDAQYWGVPQRRRRIYLVADLGGLRADEILFERKSMSGNPEPCREAREETAGTVGGSTEGSCYITTLNDQGGRVMSVSEDITGTLRAQEHGHQPIAVMRNGCGTQQSKNGGGYSLNYQNPVVYPFDMQAFGKYVNGETASSLKQRDYKDATDLVVEDCRIYPGVGITSKQNFSNPMPGDPAPTLSTDSRNYLVKDGNPPRKYIVRRLTPLECCRLQGFPDWWEDGVEGSDSARYKMWGKGMALPNMLHVMRGIADVERTDT